MTLDLGPVRKKYHDFSFRQANRNGKIYITMSCKSRVDSTFPYAGYIKLKDIMSSEFNGIRFTSGSSFSTTGVLPTMFEIIGNFE